jgi:hypothetical protein
MSTIPTAASNVIEFPDPKIQAIAREIETCTQALEEAVFARKHDLALVLATSQSALIEKLIRYSVPPGPAQDEALARLRGYYPEIAR